MAAGITVRNASTICCLVVYVDQPRHVELEAACGVSLRGAGDGLRLADPKLHDPAQPGQLSKRLLEVAAQLRSVAADVANLTTGR